MPHPSFVMFAKEGGDFSLSAVDHFEAAIAVFPCVPGGFIFIFIFLITENAEDR